MYNIKKLQFLVNNTEISLDLCWLCEITIMTSVECLFILYITMLLKQTMDLGWFFCRQDFAKQFCELDNRTCTVFKMLVNLNFN